MLCLSRKVGEKIYLGDDITVTVLQIDGRKVRIGIEAPKEMPVHREEVWNDIHQKPADAVGAPINPQPR